jgi:hypothetical protein
MKMSNQGDKEQELLMKNVIRQFMRNQLDDLEEVKNDRNNSFVFLENNTLNMLITYMLMNREYRPNQEVTRDEREFSQTEILEELDQLIADSKQEFDKIITLMKEKF